MFALLYPELDGHAACLLDEEGAIGGEYRHIAGAAASFHSGGGNGTGSIPGFTSSSSSESIVPLAKRARRQEAPVTPPKAGAPVTPPKAPAVAPAQAKAAPKLQPQPKAKRTAAASGASTPKQPPVAKASSSRPALEVHESEMVIERPAHIPADEDFVLPPMPATLNPPQEEVIWDRLATIKGKYAQAPTKILEMPVVVGRAPNGSQQT